ncbi:hypothetical protein JKP88DRAFT_252089 [Tribonema minus]|uniref:USP domain-containing protein n=1 Tax=Tribonema minus TaxID=303371 RepID=A0A836CL93_9STRA|nr:hypothetical protein JKP88DRAFT_252089 [Tribonema minus]
MLTGSAKCRCPNDYKRMALSWYGIEPPQWVHELELPHQLAALQQLNGQGQQEQDGGAMVDGEGDGDGEGEPEVLEQQHAHNGGGAMSGGNGDGADEPEEAEQQQDGGESEREEQQHVHDGGDAMSDGGGDAEPEEAEQVDDGGSSSAMFDSGGADEPDGEQQPLEQEQEDAVAVSDRDSIGEQQQQAQDGAIIPDSDGEGDADAAIDVKRTSDVIIMPTPAKRPRNASASHRGVHGLFNCGQICYFNAILQCKHIKGLVQKEQKHLMDLAIENVARQGEHIGNAALAELAESSSDGRIMSVMVQRVDSDICAQESPQQETPSQATVVVSEVIDDASPSPEPAVSEPILETLVVQPAVEQEVAVADNDAVSAAASATTEPAADTTAQSSVDAVSESSSALLTRVLEGLKSGSMTAKEAMELLTPLTKMTAVRGDRAIQKANFTAELQLQDNQSIINGTSVLGSIRRPNLAKQMQVGWSKQGEDLFKRLTELKAKTDAKMDTHGKATLVSKQNSPTRVTPERHATRVKRTQPDRRAKRDRGTTFEVLATLSGSGQDFLDAVRSLALGTESEAKILAEVEPFLNVPNEQLGMTVEEVAAAHNSNNINGALNALQASLRVILTTLRYFSNVTYRHLALGAAVAAAAALAVSGEWDSCAAMMEEAVSNPGMYDQLVFATGFAGFATGPVCVAGGNALLVGGAAAAGGVAGAAAEEVRIRLQGRRDALEAQDNMFQLFLRWERLNFCESLDMSNPVVVLDALPVHRDVKGGILRQYLRMHEPNWIAIAGDAAAIKAVRSEIENEEKRLQTTHPAVWADMQLIFP